MSGSSSFAALAVWIHADAGARAERAVGRQPGSRRPLVRAADRRRDGGLQPGDQHRVHGGVPARRRHRARTWVAGALAGDWTRDPAGAGAIAAVMFVRRSPKAAPPLDSRRTDALRLNDARSGQPTAAAGCSWQAAALAMPSSGCSPSARRSTGSSRRASGCSTSRSSRSAGSTGRLLPDACGHRDDSARRQLPRRLARLPRTARTADRPSLFILAASRHAALRMTRRWRT